MGAAKNRAEPICELICSHVGLCFTPKGHLMQKLLVATHNQGKIREYRALLGDLPLAVTWLDQEQITLEVDETGDTFVANASLKAETYARLTGLWTWADDSGLEVDALGGQPGVYSARFGGPGLSDRDRYLHLLDQLRDVPPGQRAARFRCVVAIAIPGGPVYTVHGAIEGQILDQPRGEFGFGYDPIFWIPEAGVTMAELQPANKNRISHRAIAAHNARKVLAELLQHMRRPEDEETDQPA